MAPKDKDSETQALDPYQVIADLTQALVALRQAPTTSESNNNDMKELLASVAAISQATLASSTAMAERERRAVRPSNEIPTGVSVFNRRGTNLLDYQKPPLKCEMHIPWIAEWESLTREEVELLNLLQPGNFTISKNDESVVEISVSVQYALDGVTLSRLLMNHPTAFKQENYREMPSLTRLLRDMHSHNPETHALANAILTDKAEAAMIRAGQLTVSK